MHSFHPDRLNHALVPATAAWLMGACMEAWGKQELWRQRRPDVLEALRELSIVQSAESSNRMEGVLVSKARLRPLILGNATPAERLEEVLARSSAHWHKATHELVPWWNHFLSTLRQAYISLSERLEIVGTGPGKSELVRQAILGQAPTFTLREILAACPSVSPQLARKVLSQQRADGYLTLAGRGRGARWHRRCG